MSYFKLILIYLIFALILMFLSLFSLEWLFVGVTVFLILEVVYGKRK